MIALKNEQTIINKKIATINPKQTKPERVKKFSINFLLFSIKKTLMTIYNIIKIGSPAASKMP